MDERVVTVIALYFSFFVSAAVISSITSSMTKLDLLTVQRLVEIEDSTKTLAKP